MTFVVMATVLMFTACGSDSNGDDNGSGNGRNNGGTGSSTVAGENILFGTLTGEQTLDAKEYILNGMVIIADGGCLDIPVGTIIKAREGFNSHLLVVQRDKPYADGMADKPIVLTVNTTSPVSGYRGGVIINGKTPIPGSKTSKSDTVLMETNNDYKYDGSVADDNSGSLTHVKICYVSARPTTDIEHNGLTPNGVGNGTEIENTYVSESADGVVELFGGIVNMTNLLAVNPDDDILDLTQGYCGTLKNCYGARESNYTSTEANPHGIKADGNMDGLYSDHLRQSDFKVENMTIVNDAASTVGNVDRMQDVIRIHRRAKAIITNVLVKGAGDAIDLVSMKDSRGVGNIESNINITSTLSLTGLKQNSELNTFVGSAGNTDADASLFGWTGYNLSTF